MTLNGVSIIFAGLISFVSKFLNSSNSEIHKAGPSNINMAIYRKGPIVLHLIVNLVRNLEGVKNEEEAVKEREELP